MRFFNFFQVDEGEDGWQTVGRKPSRHPHKVYLLILIINMSNEKTNVAFSVFCIILNRLYFYV